MHPPLSLILFFLTAGTSVGLFTILFVLQILSLLGTVEALPEAVLLRAGELSLLLVGAGAFAASFHLGHKLRAWKAVRRFRSSWLSREAVFSGAYGVMLLLYLIALWRDAGTPLQLLLGGLAFASGVLSAYSTAMIYATNRFVLEWNSSITVVSFLLLYLMLGSTAGAFLLELYGQPQGRVFTFLSLTFLILGFLFRIAFNVRQFYLRRPTLNDALNLPRNRPVRLLDAGTTTDNYCTTEFYYRKGKELLPTVIPVAYLLNFVVPFSLILYARTSGSGESWLLGLSYVSLLVGGALERWCFFVEGNHVQNLFYGLYPSERELR